MVNHHHSPPFGIIFLELFPSIKHANPSMVFSSFCILNEELSREKKQPDFPSYSLDSNYLL